MAPNVFLTGSTGYIGGDALYALSKAHSEYSITVLVRDSKRGGQVAAQYPSVKCAYGTLEDSAVLEEESAKADIVLHTADSSDNEGAARAIAKGLAKGHTKENPGYWLHLSGTGILTWYDQKHERYGEPPLPENAYDDFDGFSKLASMPDDAYHRNVELVVLQAGKGNDGSVKVAIVCPPTIYGQGRGPGNQRSRQVNALARATLEQKAAPQAGTGKTEWDNVRISDLSGLFVLLAEAAAARTDSPEIWGARGYFFCENGVHVWGEVSRRVARAAHAKGYIPEARVDAMSKDEAFKAAGYDAVSWGLNSRGKALRAAKVLGWKPVGRSLEEEIPYEVETEAKVMGVEPGHAKKAAGQW